MRQIEYDYYRGVYGGTEVPLAAYSGVMRRACAHVDRLTMGRASQPQDEDLQRRIADACCAVAELLYKERQGVEVVSESVGRWSRTYAASGKTLPQKIRDACRLYLDGTGLLYRGVNA